VSNRTELELVNAARTGDVDSFGELYRRHYAGVVGVAYCVLADRHLAEDAAQEAFAIACRELGRLRRADKFASWIRSITRKVSSRMTRSDSVTVTSEGVRHAAELDLEQDKSHLVRDAVMELPEKAREVVVLHYFVGLSHKEIAALIGASPEAVHGRLVRARRKLAHSLRRDGVVGVES
jgi:RNA polymerase sigma-70 factor (ECF subfamily)